TAMSFTGKKVPDENHRRAISLPGSAVEAGAPSYRPPNVWIIGNHGRYGWSRTLASALPPLNLGLVLGPFAAGPQRTECAANCSPLKGFRPERAFRGTPSARRHHGR